MIDESKDESIESHPPPAKQKKTPPPQALIEKAQPEVKIEISSVPEPKEKPKPSKAKEAAATTSEELVKNVPCTLCSKKFINLANLKRHIAMYHFRINRFGCKLCDYRGYRRIDTITHLGNLHNIQGEKDTLNEYIQLVVKSDDDGRPPINADEGYDMNVTFNSVVAQIESAEMLQKLKASTNQEIISASIKEELPLTEEEKVVSDLLSSGMSSPNCSELGGNVESVVEKRRPTRTRVKPVRKDFVYNLNTIIKQEAEVHREHQLQQTLISQNNPKSRRNTICQDVPIKESSTAARDKPKDKDKENDSTTRLHMAYSIEEVAGAALKMAKIEVMNQRACFHKPPEIPAERPFVPSITPRRLEPAQPANKRSRAKKNSPGAADKPTREIKRTLSFTDTLLLQTDTNRGKLLVERSAVPVEPIPQFPPAKPQFSLAEFTSQLAATATIEKIPKATKKQELSSKEQSQIEMLQRFRSQLPAQAETELYRTPPNNNRRMSRLTAVDQKR